MLSLLSLVFWLVACGEAEIRPERIIDEQPLIYPDYADVTVPCNISPLNFIIKDTADAYLTTFSCPDGFKVEVKGKEVRVPLRSWRKLMLRSVEERLQVQVSLCREGRWEACWPFEVKVSGDSIDTFISYRLIEPTYGMYGDMSIVQRDITSFDEREIFNNSMDYSPQSGQCINCHSYQDYRGENFQFHVRHKDGGTVISHDGTLSKRNLKASWMSSGAVYPAWHPRLPLIAYSSNNTKQFFFLRDSIKTEVIDTRSDLVLYNVQDNVMSPLLVTDEAMETFPSWSPDGSRLFYCAASLEGISRDKELNVTLYDSVRYNLMCMDFNCEQMTFSAPEVLFDAAAVCASATFPRLSPDGRYLLFTLAPFGNFHIWHKDADLCLLDMQDRSVRKLDEVNSSETDSYHAWSSNGRWILFSSRREDANYTRLYISYFDETGVAHKPFLLPQRSPGGNLTLFKSYNIPEFMKTPVPYSIKKVLRTVTGPLSGPVSAEPGTLSK